MHPSNPENHRRSIYPTNLPKPLFHPYKIPTSSTITTKHPSYIPTPTHRSTPSDNQDPFKHSSPSSSSLFSVTSQTTVYLPYHIPSRPTHKTLTNTTHQPSSTSASQTSHTHQQHKPTLMHHLKDKNQMAKTTPTNTTKPPQHPSHNTCHKHNQYYNNNNTLQHGHNQTNTIKPQHIITSTNNIATTSHPMPLLFHRNQSSHYGTPATMC